MPRHSRRKGRHYNKAQKKKHGKKLEKSMKEQILRGDGVKGWRVNEKGNLEIDYEAFKDEFKNKSDFTDFFRQALSNKTPFRERARIVKHSFNRLKATLEEEMKAFRGTARAYRIHHHNSFKNADIIQLWARSKKMVMEQLRDSPPHPFHVVWTFAVKVQFKKQNEDTFIERNVFTRKIRTHSHYQFEQEWAKVPSDLQYQMEEIVTLIGSGFKVNRFLGAWLNLIDFIPTRTGGYIEVPLYKKGLLNIRNDDSYCFLWCIAAALKPNKSHSRPNYLPQTYQKKFDELLPLVDKSDFDNGGLADIFYGKYEKIFKINLYVFEHYNDELPIYPCYRSVNNYTTKVYLLKVLQVDPDDPLQLQKCHFVLIKEGKINSLFSKLRKDISNDYSFTCEICLRHFKSEEHLKGHHCDNEFIPTTYKCPTGNLPPPNPRRKEKVPLVVYADLESLVVPTNITRGEKSRLISRQDPASYAFMMVYSREDIRPQRYDYTGEDAIEHFFETLFKRIDAIFWLYIWEGLEMDPLTPEEERAFELAEKCCLCKKELTQRPKPVRHHDHNTGKYVGPAHQFCNLQQQRRTGVVVMFHNFTGYDSHFLIKHLHHKYGNLECIANNGERFKALILNRRAPRSSRHPDYKSHGYQVKFIDSMAFQPSSLDTLFNNRIAPEFGKEPIDNCGQYLTKAIPYTHSYISEIVKDLPIQQRYLAFKLLMRKGVYPYEWVTSFGKYDQLMFDENDKFLLKPHHFRSSLMEGKQYLLEKQRQCEAVCRVLGYEEFSQYHSLYNNFDVCILADIFESYRTMCIATKGFDPCQFYGTPSLVYACFQNENRKDIELISDPDLYRKLRADGMRGGISFWRRYLTVANNPINPNYDSTQPTSYIFDQDATSLYPWAARQLMPRGNYKMHEVVLEGEEMWNVLMEYWTCNHEVGAYLWVDIHLPRYTKEWRQLVPSECQQYGDLIDKNYDGDLWDYQDNYPMLVENKAVKTEQLSDFQRYRYKMNGGHNPGVKLITDLLPKSDYMIHYQSLLFAVERGWVPTRVHRVFEFEQDFVMRNFMDTCAVARSQSQNAQEKDLHKTCMNSLIGKTIENVENYCNVKLCSGEKKTNQKGRYYNELQWYERTQKLKPGWKLINEDLAIAELHKDIVHLNKPILLGITVYDLSKILMAQLWYTLQDYYGKRIQLLGTDTDSLVFYVETEDWEGDVKELNKRNLFEGYSFFDNSRFPDDVEGPYADGIGIFDTGEKMLKSVPGFFKPDVLNIYECVAMRAKNYAFLVACDEQRWIKEDGKWVYREITDQDLVKNKGVPKGYIKEYMRYHQMKEAVLDQLQETQHSATFTNLRSIDQTVHAITQTKSIFRAVDDKRYSEDGIISFAFRPQTI